MNPDGSSDVNALSLYETSNGQTLVYGRIDGSTGTAALKITSHAAGIKVTADNIIGGSENCVDLNNECTSISVSASVFECHGKYALSAKTCNGVIFTGHISGKPSQWAINLGSWSDQSAALQQNTKLVLTADSYPITVWLGNATAPSLDNPANYRIIGFGRFGPVVRKLVMFLWGLGKKMGLKI